MRSAGFSAALTWKNYKFYRQGLLSDLASVPNEKLPISMTWLRRQTRTRERAQEPQTPKPGVCATSYGVRQDRSPSAPGKIVAASPPGTISEWRVFRQLKQHL